MKFLLEKKISMIMIGRLYSLSSAIFNFKTCSLKKTIKNKKRKEKIVFIRRKFSPLYKISNILKLLINNVNKLVLVIVKMHVHHTNVLTNF